MRRQPGASASRAAEDAPARPIRFGTSGWRGVRGTEFTLPRVRVAVRAVGRWLAEEHAGAEVVVARDTRAGGAECIEAAVAELTREGFRVTELRGCVPTPVAVHALQARAAAAAIVFTASHNPPEYGGMKVFGAWGGILAADSTRRIEQLAAASATGVEAALAAEPAARTDAVPAYVEALLALVDRASLASSDLQVVYDAMHGAGGGVLDRALAEAGVSLRTLRPRPDPDFGGGAPDPVPERLGELRSEVRRVAGPVLGLATDGDADRFALVGHDGECLHATDAAALLVDHLAQTGRLARGVAISRATGSLVERVARSHGLAVERHDIGFKHLSAALRAGEVDAACEESGGFAFARFGCDKDGMLAGLLAAEMMAQDARPLALRLAELRARHGSGVCGRTALAVDPRTLAAFEARLLAPPANLGGVRVEVATAGDGLHLALADGFLMLRPSGTEPLLRIYAEAPDAPRLEQRLAAGRALLAGGTR